MANKSLYDVLHRLMFEKDNLPSDSDIYRFETFRLLTFHEEVSSVDILGLSSHGFYFKNNNVQCYKCGASHLIEDVSNISNFLQLHQDNCAFIFTICEDNVEIGSENMDLIDIIDKNWFLNPVSERIQKVQQCDSDRNMIDETSELKDSNQDSYDNDMNYESKRLDNANSRNIQKDQHCDSDVNVRDGTSELKDSNQDSYDNEMRYELKRLETFRDWPKNDIMKPNVLSSAGFYFLGIDDKVQCAFCDGQLQGWFAEDNPFQQHQRLFPDCKFVQMLNVGNVPHSSNISKPSLIEPNAFDRDNIEKLLEMGFGIEPIKSALLKLKTGGNSPSISEIIDSISITSLGKGKSNCYEFIGKNSDSLQQSSFCSECKICLSEQADIVFKPCNHLCACSSCASQLKKCPICRNEILYLEKIYPV